MYIAVRIRNDTDKTVVNFFGCSIELSTAGNTGCPPRRHAVRGNRFIVFVWAESTQKEEFASKKIGD
jgi:hypothetical protein